MRWEFNRDYHDLGQVEQFWPAYLARYDELTEAGRYPYNDDFKGRIPGVEGRAEDTAIYLLQKLRRVRELAAKVAEYRAGGWRDFDPATLDGTSPRFAGVAEYAFENGETGFREWGSARITRWHRAALVLPGRNRTRGNLIAGRILVRD